MNKKEFMTVGELAKKMNTTVRTLQYYDKEGLLHPSLQSEGGRRLYTNKDMAKLHQILAMKFLGFSLNDIRDNLISLDTPEDMLEVLSRQEDVVKEKLRDLKQVLSAIDLLRDEIINVKKIDFEKYAQIIELLRMNKESYWVIKSLDDNTLAHIQDKFTEETGAIFFDKWESLCKEIITLQEKGETPESEGGQKIATNWWAMVMDFTGGDMTLLPKLMEFNNNRENWDKKAIERMTLVDEFIKKAMEIYFTNQSVAIPNLETSEETVK